MSELLLSALENGSVEPQARATSRPNRENPCFGTLERQSCDFGRLRKSAENTVFVFSTSETQIARGTPFSKVGLNRDFSVSGHENRKVLKTAVWRSRPKSEFPRFRSPKQENWIFGQLSKSGQNGESRNWRAKTQKLTFRPTCEVDPNLNFRKLTTGNGKPQISSESKVDPKTNFCVSAGRNRKVAKTVNFANWSKTQLSCFREAKRKSRLEAQLRKSSQNQTFPFSWPRTQKRQIRSSSKDDGFKQISISVGRNVDSRFSLDFATRLNSQFVGSHGTKRLPITPVNTGVLSTTEDTDSFRVCSVMFS